MSKNKKIVLIISIALVSIILLIGVTYALNYTQTGTNQQLVLGDIYMRYNEVSGLSITDAVPGSDYSNYFEFTISGKNTYTKKDIYYDFILNRGDLPTNKTEDNRIPDKYLKFKLVSVDTNNQETIIFQDETYDSLNNQRIYVETIEKNTTSEVNRTYRLYMTIDNSLLIGNTSDAVFTFSEFENAFANVKVNVTGNFNEKNILTYEDCFETSELSDGTLEITDYYKYGSYNYNTSSYNENSLCTSEVVIPNEIGGKNITSIGDSSFTNLEITSVVIPDGVRMIASGAFENNDLTTVVIPNSVQEIGYLAFADNQLKNVDILNESTHIVHAAFNDNLLPDSEAFFYGEINDGDGNYQKDDTRIISYGGENRNVVIPNNVKTIGEEAFKFVNLESIFIPNTVTKIESAAFEATYLRNIDLPESIVEIGNNVFSQTRLTTLDLKSVQVIGTDIIVNSIYIKNIIVGDKIRYIDSDAFHTDGSLESVTIDKTCDEIKKIAFDEDIEDTGYPWLGDADSGVTIYGANNEVCDSF